MKLKCCVLLLLVSLVVSAKRWTPTDVEQVIRKVNTYWQANNKAEVRAFWDNAAYHTGNVEVYKLLTDDGIRLHSSTTNIFGVL